MFMYFVLPLLVPIGYYLFYKNEKRDDIVLISIISLMFIILCLRNTFGFLDLPAYHDGYYKVATFSLKEMLLGTRLFQCNFLGWMESGYAWLNWILAKIGLDFQVLLIVHAAFVSLSIFLFIRKFSLNPCFSIFFFLCFGGLSDHMYILRQSFAFAILLFATTALVEKKPIRCALLVILAILFHRVSLSFILIFPLSFIKVNRKNAIISVASSISILALIPIMMPLLELILGLLNKSSYINHLNAPEFKEMIIVIVGMIALSIMLISKDKELDRPNMIVYWLSIISLLLMNISVYVPIISRVGMSMYLPFLSILVPNLIKMNEDKKIVKYITIALCVLLFMFLVFKVISQGYSYTFVWENVEL